MVCRQKQELVVWVPAKYLALLRAVQYSADFNVICTRAVAKKWGLGNQLGRCLVVVKPVANGRFVVHVTHARFFQCLGKAALQNVRCGQRQRTRYHHTSYRKKQPPATRHHQGVGQQACKHQQVAATAL